MKIGILTFHDALNCGAALQAYALQEYLIHCGYEVEFINYSCRPPFSIKRLLGKTIRNTIVKIRAFINATIYNHDTTYNQFLNVGKKINDSKSLELTNNEYDLFIVGSDQVWNFKRNLNMAYLLDFVHPDKKKIAYAVSMGQCEVPAILHQDLKSRLKTFAAISCREQNAVEFLNNLLGKSNSVLQCVDPTLLIPKDYYERIMKKTERADSIVSYILNSLSPSQEKMIESYCKEKNISLINLRNPDTCVQFDFCENLVTRPAEWLGFIYDAKAVICGSFHATVFSLIFHKPFVVIESEDIYATGGNQRIRSLLRPLGLEYRCICKEDIDSILEKQIDWSEVDARIDMMRIDSQDFLNRFISM